LLDPDGDLVRTLRETGRAKPFAGWPCYHSELDIFSLAGQEVGIVGRAVGASFAVLVAEELFASGCRLLVSLTSAGQITPSGPPPYFVIIDRALRDEGTSYHYLPPSDFAEADPKLVLAAGQTTLMEGPRVIVGSTCTTDAPFRKGLKRSKPQETGEFLASKWRRRHSTLLHIRQACRSYVLRISPTPWVRTEQISRRAKPMAQGTR
jgi:uridine phosphorylase